MSENLKVDAKTNILEFKRKHNKLVDEVGKISGGSSLPFRKGFKCRANSSFDYETVLVSYNETTNQYDAHYFGGESYPSSNPNDIENVVFVFVKSISCNLGGDYFGAGDYTEGMDVPALNFRASLNNYGISLDGYIQLFIPLSDFNGVSV